MGDPALAKLVGQIARARGFTCDAYKESCLRRRLAVRMRACGVHTFEEYGRVLESDAAEYDRLLDTLTINVTKLYRNRETWDVLSQRYLPELWDRRAGALRCWSAGCASGEEPYTLALLLLEIARSRQVDGRVLLRIDATDIDVASLERAKGGRYGQQAFDELPGNLAERYFSGDRERSISAEARAIVRYRRHDLLRDPPPDPPYDLILCRNVVIYFERPAQERLFNVFADALTGGGLLVLGKVETIFGAARSRLELDDVRERIYRRK